MHIKFIKDYKCYQKGDIVLLKDWFAKKIVKSGFAEQISNSFRIGDLYVVPIIQPTDFATILHTEGKTKHIGIFTKEVYTDRIGFNQAKYIHCLTEKEYETNSLKDYGPSEYLVVDETKEQEFCEYFLDEVMQKGWSESVRLSLEDIREIENKINRNINKNIDNENERV